MKRIDRETSRRILDTANIVEVVSDFVSLKRRGANYIGLCPFHNERTPSFSVSPAKGICKCFSCGKGGSPVNFVMEHEQMTFNEALRYLAKKYNIEIREEEVSEEERERESARQIMFALNDFAMRHFENTLVNTVDGREIGLAYFRQRGINDMAIKRFHLGYSLEKGNTLLNEAKASGFSEKILTDTGIAVRRDDGSMYDRFRGRVIYPVHTISGKVVAFGGRTLRSDKKVAKYVNSPESVIYSKSHELYGLFQAKKSIVEKKKCILVEGYMDVISMSQLGVENVVASSGTSLTDGQIRLIHRFCENVTVIYDSDAAGIKASLRGIDLLLAEGLAIKVVLLPDGDDPDSFAQAHSLSEVEEYIEAHETDFIRFKTDILLKDAGNDPTRRAHVIADIVGSIAVIPDEITRTVYTSECAHSLGIDEKVLVREIRRRIAKNREEQALKRQRQQARDSLGDISDRPEDGAGQGATARTSNATAQTSSSVTANAYSQPIQTQSVTASDPDTASDSADGVSVEIPTDEDPSTLAPLDPHTDEIPPATTYAHAPRLTDAEVKAIELARYLRPIEEELLRYIIKYGMVSLDFNSDDGDIRQITVAEYIANELRQENLQFSNSDFERIFNRCLEARKRWESDSVQAQTRFLQERDEELALGRQEIAAQAQTSDQIKAMETALAEKVDENYWLKFDTFTDNYLIRLLTSSSDTDTRTISTNLAAEPYQLSKYHSKYAKIETERDKLFELLPKAVYCIKSAHADVRIKEKQAQLKQSSGDPEAMQSILAEIAQLYALRSSYSHNLGERVLIPKK